jgi:hypothetical protein
MSNIQLRGSRRTGAERWAVGIVGGVVVLATGGAVAYAIGTGGAVVMSGGTVVAIGAAAQALARGRA